MKKFEKIKIFCYNINRKIEKVRENTLMVELTLQKRDDLMDAFITKVEDASPTTYEELAAEFVHYADIIKSESREITALKDYIKEIADRAINSTMTDRDCLFLLNRYLKSKNLTTTLTAPIKTVIVSQENDNNTASIVLNDKDAKKFSIKITDKDDQIIQNFISELHINK